MNRQTYLAGYLRKYARAVPEPETTDIPGVTKVPFAPPVNTRKPAGKVAPAAPVVKGDLDSKSPDVLAKTKANPIPVAPVAKPASNVAANAASSAQRTQAQQAKQAKNPLTPTPAADFWDNNPVDKIRQMIRGGK